MTKGTQLWPGDRMRSFFRAHIRRETSLDDAAADKLSEALTKAVNRMLVWDRPADAPGGEMIATPAVATKAKGKAALSAEAPATASQPAAAFDPYTFSVIVALAKSGRDGLMKRLAEIKSADNLKKLAEAQHLAVNPALKKPDELRKAIIAATEQRLADRKAAAS